MAETVKELAARFEHAMHEIQEALTVSRSDRDQLRESIEAMANEPRTGQRHDDETFLELCRAEFADDQIGKLPRVTCFKCKDARSGTCDEHQRKQKCPDCKQYITPAHMHIPFVGHADLTDRLLSIDPLWEWKPMAMHPSGFPHYDVVNGQAVMWIYLTIDGRTRQGVGTAPAGKAELHKELIGDALRNAAMRFGIALYLWSKSDKLESQMDENEPQQQNAQNGRSQPPQGNPAPNTAPTPQESPQGAASTAPEGSGVLDLVGQFGALSNKATRTAAKMLREEGLWPVAEIPSSREQDAAVIMEEAAALEPS